MRKIPGDPIPWRQGNPLTAKHLDANRRVISELLQHQGPQQLDEPAADADEQSSAGNAEFVSKTTRTETINVLDDSSTVIGTLTVEITIAVQLRRDGITFWTYLE